MANTYVSLYTHLVFSTKDRRPLINSEIRPRLWAYLGGIAAENRCKAMSVGGTDNHAHLLLSAPATLPIAEAVKLLKGNSSKWINETFALGLPFRWQAGYGAFSVGISQIEVTRAYIANQEEHHRTHTFEEEYVRFLDKHGVSYEERYLWT